MLIILTILQQKTTRFLGGLFDYGKRISLFIVWLI